jgi:hypothetical protein
VAVGLGKVPGLGKEAAGISRDILQLGCHASCCVTSGQILAHSGSLWEVQVLNTVLKTIAITTSLWGQEPWSYLIISVGVAHCGYRSL